jgi:succinate-acetate transporter protein
MSEATAYEIKDTTANPAPLGLLAFGMTTVFLNLHNAGVYEFNAMILGMGLFYGGVAQIIAGIMEWKKKNTFGLTAFASYGFFWLVLVALLVFPKLGWGEKSSNMAMAWFLGMWGLFTLLMFVGTLRISRALQFVFATLTILYALLAIGEATEISLITKIAGHEGIICGLSAIYAGIAQVINEVYKRTVFPLGNVQ